MHDIFIEFSYKKVELNINIHISTFRFMALGQYLMNIYKINTNIYYYYTNTRLTLFILNNEEKISMNSIK